MYREFLLLLPESSISSTSVTQLEVLTAFLFPSVKSLETSPEANWSLHCELPLETFSEALSDNKKNIKIFIQMLRELLGYNYRQCTQCWLH